MTASILLPTDYSPAARRAYRIALGLAQESGANLEVLHAWSAPFFGPGYNGSGSAGTHASLFALIRQQAETEMESFLASAEVPSGVTVTSHVVSGEPVHAVLEQVEKGGTGLVVTGSHGRKGAAYLFLGSVAARLVQLSECPVLVVPPPGEGAAAEWLAPRRIVVAVDFSPVTGEAVGQAMRIAARHGSKVELLHVVAPPSMVMDDLTLWDQVAVEHRRSVERDLEVLAEGLDVPAGVQVTRHVEIGVPATVIDEAAKGADLVVIGTHGRTGLSRLVLGSVAEKVARTSPCPVLTVKSAPAA